MKLINIVLLTIIALSALVLFYNLNKNPLRYDEEVDILFGVWSIGMAVGITLFVALIGHAIYEAIKATS
jgi:hypothetical protein